MLAQLQNKSNFTQNNDSVTVRELRSILVTIF